MSVQRGGFDSVITQLRKSLHDLDEKDQLVLRLRFWGGMTCRQIAELLGEKRDAVRMRCYRAQARLHALLANYES